MSSIAKFDFSDRVAIVTGAARGIGLVTAQRLFSDGARVALMDQNAKRLAQTLTLFGNSPSVRAYELDVSNYEQVNQVFHQVHKDFGSLDILINNAGVSGPSKPAIEYNDHEWRRVMSTNLDGAFWCCRAAVPLMARGGWGRVVNVTSVAGKEGNPNGGAYSASKAGLIGLTKSLAKEMAQSGVLINCVAPTGVNTEILSELSDEKLKYMLGRVPMGRFAEAEEVAAMIVWLASDECSFATGAVFDVSGGRLTY